MSALIQNLSPAQSFGEKLLGSVDWKSEFEGYSECPCSYYHSNPNQPRDCRITLDQVPTIHCVHTSCAQGIASFNYVLRSVLLPKVQTSETEFTESSNKSSERTSTKLAKNKIESIREAAKKSLPAILQKYQSTVESFAKSTPSPIPDNAAEHWKLLLSLFEPSDTIWIGSKFDSGEGKERHFRQVSEWISAACAPAQFTCPSVFSKGVTSRSNKNVTLRRFLVVESDTLTKDNIIAIFSWLNTILPLRAVVDTAGRSLHGWFEFPQDQECLEQLKVILPAMECDAALFKASQPCRLPGAERDGKLQSLVWFKKGGAR